MVINLSFKGIKTSYKRIANYYNKIIITIVILVGVLAVYLYFNQPKDVTLQSTPKVETGELIYCTQTGTVDLEDESLIQINTVIDISLINYEKEVLVAQNKRNYIPAINKPSFVSYRDLECLKGTNKVLVIQINNTVRVYPLAILDYHVVINDIVGDSPISIVYSPISGLYRVFNTKVKNDILMFAHTGSLYKNTDLIVDNKSDSLWSTMDGKALVGVMAGAKLEQLNYNIMDYSRAIKLYPEGKIMNFMTGYRRSYGIDPFIEYKTSNLIFQEPVNKSKQLIDKQTVLGFELNGLHYAVSLAEFGSDKTYEKTINQKKLKIVRNQGQFYIYDISDSEIGKELNYDRAYWFVWYDYYPETRVI